MTLRTISAALSLGAAALVSATAAAQGSFDDVKGRAMDFATHQIEPLAQSIDGNSLYVLNQPGSRLAIFELPSLAPIADIPVSPGLVSVVERVPGEVWLVDAVQHSISVVDAATQVIERTIRVGAEPHGLVFTPDGSRAYVACSAVHRVDVIDTATMEVVNRIDVPAMNPRAIAWQDGRVWVASFRSGNNTAPMGSGPGGDANDVVEVRNLADFPMLPQLPDRDVFSITPQADPANDALDATVHTGVGTILMNMSARPGTSELWIPNTEALNDEFRGEKAFIEGQIVSNRVTILDAGSGAQTVLDLEALAPDGAECAQPSHVSFTADGSRAFVTGYNSDRIAVLDLEGGGQVTWAGHIDVIPGQAYPEGSGPRATLVSEDESTLFVFSKIDNGFAAVPLAALPTTPRFTYTAPFPHEIGFSPVAGRELRGRFLFVNAKFSKSGTSSCASCHIDATTDGIAWDLSGFLDPEGTAPDAMQFPVDRKGPLVTQNTLRLAETAPYHWRGEKKVLTDFNGAFRDLLENEEGGVPSTIGGHFQYIAAYMRHLAIPANPRQELDRSLTAEQARGEDLFLNAASFDGMACVDCHSLPFGTSGELVSFKRGGTSKSGVVPHLRGVADKLSPPFHIGGRFGTRTETGSGLLHGGAIGGLLQLLLMEDPGQPGQQLFNLTLAEARDIAAYLEAFDTGLAPSTTLQITAHPGNWNDEARDMVELLMDQAAAGHCELICRRTPVGAGPGLVHRSMMYDPSIDKFVPAQQGGQKRSVGALLLEASNGSPVTFLGVPGHTGLQMALDRDVDGLLDLDELALGTDPELLDHDEDGFPDGYEITWGLDPLVADASSPDATAPSLLAAPRLIYATQTAIKVELETDEPARLHVMVNGKIIRRAPFGPGFDTEFSLVLPELKAGKTVELSLEVFDPAENTRTVTYMYDTAAKVFEQPAFVRGIVPTIVPAVTGGGNDLFVTVTLAQGNAPAISGYQVTASVYHQLDATGALTLISPAMQPAFGGRGGRVTLRTAVPSQAALGGPGKLIIAVQDVVPPAGAAPYVEALDKAGVVETSY